MRTLLVLASLLVPALACTTAAPPPPAGPTDPAAEPAGFRASAPPPLESRPYRFPEVTRVTLDNGLRILVAENHAAPLVTLRAVIRSGAEHDPADHAGLATFTADMLDEGAGGKSGVELAEAFGNLGTEIGTWAEWDMTGAGLDVLSSRFEPALALFADVLLRPEFPQAEVERLRTQRRATLIQMRDNASVVATNRFAAVVYGATPYGRSLLGDESTVANITRDDVLAFYRRHVVPNNTSIIVTGDVDAAEAVRLVRTQFESWPRGSFVPEITVEPPPIEASRIVIVDRPQAVQSEIRVGHPGVERTTEDYFPLLVMNTILGGNFGSRINLNLRERHGYTYGARSAFAFRREPGPFVVSTPVRTEVTLPAVREIMKELREIRTGSVTAAELEAAKNYQAGVFPATVESASDLANRLAELETYGLPENDFDTYQQRIMAVTEEDVRRVANRYLDPDRVAIVIVGKSSDIRAPLGELGVPISVVDVDGVPLEE